MEAPRPTKKQPIGVDDMMERLKSRPSSGGSRVVTVETVDGEVVEVRKKRKRRSHQPKKVREARISMLRKLILFGLIPLLVLMIVGWYVMVLRYKGESFRADLSERISEVLGLKCDIASLDPDGTSVGARRLFVKGSPNSLLREVEAMDLMATLGFGTHFSKDWNIDNLSVRTCRIDLQETDGSTAAILPGLESPRQLLAAGLGLSSRPGAFNVDFFRLSECKIVWNPRDEDIDPYTILDDALLTSSDVGGGSHFSLTLGRLMLRTWPELDIDHGKLAISKDGIEIEEVRMQREAFGDAEGIIRGEGEIRFGRRTTSDMDFEFKRVDLRDFLPNFWQDKLIGKISGKMSVQSQLGQPDSLVAEGYFNMPGGVLGNLPNLKRLHTYVGDANLARLLFEDKLTGKFRMSSAGVEIFAIEGEAPNLFRMRGNVTFRSDGRVEGALEVGIPEIILQARKGGIPEFFGPVEDEFCWASVILDGKRDDVRDDLTARFEEEARLSQEQEREARFRAGADLPPQPQPQAVPGVEKKDGQDQLLENAFDQLIGK